MRALLLVAALLLVTLAVPPAAGGQPCTTPPKDPVGSVLWAAGCTVERLPDTGPLEPELATTEIDLRWMTSCPGPWGHEERTDVGPVVIVTYECDDGS